MSNEELLKKLLDKARGKADFSAIGLGIAKEIASNACSVEREGAPTLLDVRFHAVEDALNSTITVFPKDGSYVLYGIIGRDQTSAVIISCSEVERVMVKIGRAVYEVTEAGHEIRRGNNNLKTVLSDFIDEVIKIIVINGTSPNVPALQDIKLKLSEILK